MSGMAKWEASTLKVPASGGYNHCKRAIYSAVTFWASIRLLCWLVLANAAFLGLAANVVSKVALPYHGEVGPSPSPVFQPHFFFDAFHASAQWVKGR